MTVSPHDLVSLKYKILALVKKAGTIDLPSIVREVQKDSKPSVSVKFIQEQCWSLSKEELPSIVIGDNDVCKITEFGSTDLALFEEEEDDILLSKDLGYIILSLLEEQRIKADDKRGLTYQEILSNVERIYPMELARVIVADVLEELVVEQKIGFTQADFLKTSDINFCMRYLGLIERASIKEQLESFGQD